MPSQRDSYEQAFNKLGSFADNLYVDGDPFCNEIASNEEAAPIFQALSEVEQRYQEAILIGQGGMKEVFKVYDLRSCRYVALAKPKKELSKIDYDAFLREAHITARLSHPGILNLYNIGICEDSRPFFTMEFKRGNSLRQLLKSLRSITPHDNQQNLKQRLNIFLRICESVAYAHSCRVLHLDIKPENIQVGTLGEVQFCDWGMGVVLPSTEDTHDSHNLDDNEVTLDPDLYGPLLNRASGTLGYMAPEQKKPREPKTTYMDIYALGCVLQELICLDLTESNISVKDKVLKAIVDKARHDHPEKRYGTVELLHKDISRYLNGYSTSVEDAGFLRELNLFFKRNPGPCSMTLFFTLLIVVGTIGFIGQIQDSRHEAEHAQQKYQNEKEASKQKIAHNANEVLYMTRSLSEDSYMGPEVYKAAVMQSFRQLQSILAQNPPEDSKAYGKMIWYQFILQDFSGALKILKKVPPPNNIISQIPYIKKYAPKLNELGFLPTKSLINLMQDVYSDLNEQSIDLVHRMVFYDVHHVRSTEDYTQILRSLIKLKNPQWQTDLFDFDEATRKLKISGSHFRTGSFQGYNHKQQTSVLQILDPIYLDISNSRIADMQQLRGLSLLELNLSSIPHLTNLDSLNDMRSLRKIIIDEGQLTPAQTKQLKPYIEIIISEK